MRDMNYMFLRLLERAVARQTSDRLEETAPVCAYNEGDYKDFILIVLTSIAHVDPEAILPDRYGVFYVTCKHMKNAPRDTDRITVHVASGESFWSLHQARRFMYEYAEEIYEEAMEDSNNMAADIEDLMVIDEDRL